MKHAGIALWVAFGVALGLGFGCSDSNRPASGSSKINLDGATYTEKYTCNEQFGGGPPTTCPDLNVVDVIAFTSTGVDTYTGLDVPDTGFVYTGTMSGTTFTWSATSPAGYTETGVWTFSADGSSFSGSSNYVANDLSYSGTCNTNGVLGTVTTPPDPPLPSGCP
jgi:hypothetical protein